MKEVTLIQVAGEHTFPGNRWREAILFYLFGLLGEKDKITHRPKMKFLMSDGSSVTIRLNTMWEKDGLRYYVYGDVIPYDAITDSHEQCLKIRRNQLDVQDGLFRFVKNERIRQLDIFLPQDSCITLGKSPKERGHLGISAEGKAIQPGIGIPY